MLLSKQTDNLDNIQIFYESIMNKASDLAGQTLAKICSFTSKIWGKEINFYTGVRNLSAYTSVCLYNRHFTG